MTASPQQLVARIRLLGDRVWLLRIVYGAAGLAIAALVAVLLLGLADYFLRLEELGARIVAAVALWGVLASGFGYFFWSAWNRRFSELEVAQRIEQRYPQLADRLASTLDFLGQSETDPSAGSLEMRRAVVMETVSAFGDVREGDVIDSRPVTRMLWGVGGIVLLAAILTLCDPSSALLAVERLALPWAAAPWPHEHELTFEDLPKYHPLGQDLELTLVDKKSQSLPRTIEFTYRLAGEPNVHQKRYEAVVGNRVAINLAHVTRTIEVRAAGGDDDTQWRKIEVIDPPRVAKFTAELTPPAYTGRAVETSTGRLQMVAGTSVRLAGEVTDRVTAVAIRVTAGGKTTRIAGQVLDDGRRFVVPAEGKKWLPEMSGAYGIELATAALPAGEAGLVDTRYELEVQADRPPAISLEEPASNRHITPDASVPIRALVKDDLGVRKVELHYERSDASDKQPPPIVLYSGRETPAPRKGSSMAEAGDSQRIVYDWDLRPLALEPGAVITIYLSATDYKPASADGPIRRLTVIAPEELEDRLGLRQSQLLGQLAEALRIERQVRMQTAAVATRLSAAGVLLKQELNQLQGVELSQREVERIVAGETDGIVPQLRELLAEMDRNRLDRPAFRRRIEQLLEALGKLAKEELPPLARELLTAVKAGQALVDRPGGELREASAALATAVPQEDAIIATFERLLGELAQWDNYRRFGRELGQLARDQRDLRSRAQLVRQSTLGREVSELTPQERADLKVLSQEQLEFSRRIDRLAGQMEALGKTLKADDPLGAQTLADAVETIRRRTIAGQMRDSARLLDENQMGPADAAQEQALAGLEEALDVLANRREHELERLVEKLREASGELAGLKEQQEALRTEAEKAAALKDPREREEALQRLARKQQELADKMQHLARRLERLQAEKAAEQLNQAADDAGDAAKAEQGGAGEKALQEAEEAVQKLEQAKQQLAQKQKEAEAQLAQEQLARFEQAVEGLLKRQQAIMDETARLEGLKQAASQLTRAQLSSFRDVAKTQRLLSGEVKTSAEKVASAVVVHEGLQGVVREMVRAADRLDNRDTAAETQAIERSAHRRLTLIKEALTAQNKNEPKPEEDGGGQGGGNQKQQPPPDGIQGLAELRLLKALQKEVLDRTKALAGQPAEAATAERRQQEFVELAQEQGRLAELVLELLRPKAQAPEDNPEKLPGEKKAEPDKEKEEQPNDL